MDGMSMTTLLVLTGVCVGTYLILARVVASSQDAREPPLVTSSVPFVGHVIGLMRSKFNYYVQLSQQQTAPIFTMMMPGQKMYIVTSTELVQAIQKQPKALAFPPIAAKFSSKICGSSPEAHKILMKNVNGDEGDWGLSMESYAAMRAALSAGPGLDSMNRVMIQTIAASLDKLQSPADLHTKIKLNQWLQKSVTAATTLSVYGPQNPFADEAVAESFWQFESDMISILVGLLPSIMARKGLAARAKVVQAFEHYFRTGGHKQASVLMRNRYETSFKNGISVEDIARYEVGGATAILVNTAPAAFWMLLLIYSSPGLLNEIRKEVDPILHTTELEGEVTRSLDVTSLKANCPLLTSTFQEVLRYRSIGTSIRQVMEDTVLNGQWLLKKDAMIQMPSRVIHKDSSVWGGDVDDFDPRRFMKTHKRANGDKPPPVAAFRAFGGGTTLCPGRHFATNEVLAVATMFLLRYDMIPVGGEWSMPKTEKTNVTSVIMEPDTDIEVEVYPRKGFETGRWVCSLRDSGKVFAVVAEDREE